MRSHKKYIWAFPGIGKSFASRAMNLCDADCEQFKYLSINELSGNLHRAGEWEEVIPDLSYPDNYLSYIESLDAEIVLINCHAALLDRLEKEQVLLVYPNEALIPEYLQRYEDRGDNASFVSYMQSEAARIIQSIKASNYKKYEITDNNVYLSDLFERKDFKMKVMTRDELINHLRRAMDLKVIDTVFKSEQQPKLVCDIAFANRPQSEMSHRLNVPQAWADAVLDGKFELDIDQLISVCDKYEQILAAEEQKTERRGGLTHEELKDKIMQGIVNGALGIRYAQLAPYSHGYQVTFGLGNPMGSTQNAKNSWSCYCDLFDVPETVVRKIEDAVPCGEKPVHIKQILMCINAHEADKLTTFTPEDRTNFERRSHYRRGDIATVMDVHKGKGLDGIIKHHYHGDYSSMTPSAQNDLVDTLVCLKGFCLDCIDYLPISTHKQVIEYLKNHGTDISTDAKLKEWIEANPEKCGKAENRDRKTSLDSKIQSAVDRNNGACSANSPSFNKTSPIR